MLTLIIIVIAGVIVFQQILQFEHEEEMAKQGYEQVYELGVTVWKKADNQQIEKNENR